MQKPSSYYLLFSFSHIGRKYFPHSHKTDENQEKVLFSEFSVEIVDKQDSQFASIVITVLVI